MFHVKLEKQYGKTWYRKDGVWVSGYLHHGDKVMEKESLAALLASPAVVADRAKFLRNTNGFFSVASLRGNELWAASDHVRSFPLFYAQKGNDFYLSDEAEWVRRQVAATEIDPLAEAEFRALLCVTGPDTLIPEVHQLQAGEHLIARETGGELSVLTERYYRYLHHDYFTDDFETLLKQYDEVMLRVAQRLIDSLQGRPAVIPLSGGYDSRLVTILLHRLGYKNISCLSYGRAGSFEPGISKMVAETLGYKWQFVPYTNESWREYFESSRRPEYERFSDGLSTMPHLQDWPAVWKLKEDNLIPQDAIFVPGHSADYLVGSHLGWYMPLAAKGGLDEAVHILKTTHYIMTEESLIGRELWQGLDRRIAKALNGLACDTVEDVLDACESFDWQERQGKRITNAVRVYEYWGYEWRMPLWDSEMVEFWERVPLKFRDGTVLYDTYVIRQGQPFGFPAKPPKHRKFKNLVKSVLSCIGMKKYYLRKRNRNDYKNHPLAFFGLVPPEEFEKVVDSSVPFFPYRCDVRLREIRQILKQT